MQESRPDESGKWMRGAPLNPILPSRPDVGCCLQHPIPIYLNYCVKHLENHLYLIQWEVKIISVSPPHTRRAPNMMSGRKTILLLQSNKGHSSFCSWSSGSAVKKYSSKPWYLFCSRRFGNPFSDGHCSYSI